MKKRSVCIACFWMCISHVVFSSAGRTKDLFCGGWTLNSLLNETKFSESQRNKCLGIKACWSGRTSSPRPRPPVPAPVLEVPIYFRFLIERRSNRNSIASRSTRFTNARALPWDTFTTSDKTVRRSANLWVLRGPNWLSMLVLRAVIWTIREYERRQAGPLDCGDVMRNFRWNASDMQVCCRVWHWCAEQDSLKADEGLKIWSFNAHQTKHICKTRRKWRRAELWFQAWRTETQLQEKHPGQRALCMWMNLIFCTNVSFVPFFTKFNFASECNIIIQHKKSWRMGNIFTSFFKHFRMRRQDQCLPLRSWNRKVNLHAKSAQERSIKSGSGPFRTVQSNFIQLRISKLSRQTHAKWVRSKSKVLPELWCFSWGNLTLEVLVHLAACCGWNTEPVFDVSLFDFQYSISSSAQTWDSELGKSRAFFWMGKKSQTLILSRWTTKLPLLTEMNYSDGNNK